MKAQRILAVLHLFFAALYLIFVAFAPWTKRGDPDPGAFVEDGGTGFGIVAVIIGVALVALAVMRLAGRHKVLPGLGVEQLTIGLGIAAVANLIGFVVGWLAVFETGTGWGIPAAYFPASFIPQIGLLTLAMAEPPQGIEPLDPGTRRTFSGVALLAGLGVALFPFLTWLSAGSVSLTGFDASSELADGTEVPSGPRLAYILLIVGAIVVVAAAMRLRPKGLTEPGPALLLSHALLGAGLVAFLLPLATLISVLQKSGVDAGIGIWLGLLAGLVLIGLALAENSKRRAIGV